MLLDLSTIEIYVRPGHTDMHKAINGLTVMVQDYMYQNPLSGSLYLFCNRQRRILKALYWDRNGFLSLAEKIREAQIPLAHDPGGCATDQHRTVIAPLEGD
ncbi:IS66 family insertion sequence element accessory protein TnpB [Marispirochaeta sp.]|uniref:IS66 family insertion sequence element accessory protein TnpB n=1 Tax=Marispirochaeta sp. TaxID=2038653 RepID=UPI0029C8264D|nr:IS66 family insertion sequence element accessory protein TnpB [Marispirochaeta sp.]